MAKRNRNRRPARPISYRESKPIILVVTEGVVTEPEYLHGLVEATKNPRVEIEVFGGVGAPRTIVESARDRKKEAEKRAQRERDDNLRYDEVWCVFDIDEHPNVQDAKQMALDNGICLAISNPCIELWLWLHFADQPGMRHRHELQKMMKQHVSDYDKHVDYPDYAKRVCCCDETRVASRLDADAEADNDEGRNPTTSFWRLTESIRSSV